MSNCFYLIFVLAILGAGALGWFFINAKYYFDLIDNNCKQCADDHDSNCTH